MFKILEMSNLIHIDFIADDVVLHLLIVGKLNRVLASSR